MKAFWHELNLPINIGSDPLVALISSYCPNLPFLNLISSFLPIFIFLSTSSLLFKENRLFKSWILFLSIFIVFGYSSLFFRLQWYPLFLYSLGLKDKTLKSTFLVIISSILWALSAGDLAFAGAIVALFTLKDKISFNYLVALILCFCLLPKGFSGMPQQGNYGVISTYSFLRVPPLGTWYGRSYVDIGSFFLLNKILLLRFSILSLSLFSIIIYLKPRVSVSFFRLHLKTLVIPTSVTFILILATYYPFTNYGDTLYTLISGLIPNLAYLYSPFFLVLVLLLPFLVKLLDEITISRLLFPFLVTGILLTPVTENSFFNSNLKDLTKVTHYSKDLSKKERIMLSPSAKVVNYFGSWVVENLDTLKGYNTLVPVGDMRFNSFNNEDASNLTDSDQSTFWSTKRAQKKGDWFSIEFDQPTELSVISLSPGVNFADFPRDIILFADSKFIPLYNRNISTEWLGALGVTKDGFPYFRGQKDVVYYLPQKIKAKKLKFELLGGHETFHWSIAEVRVFNQERVKIATKAERAEIN